MSYGNHNRQISISIDQKFLEAAFSKDISGEELYKAIGYAVLWGIHYSDPEQYNSSEWDESKLSMMLTYDGEISTLYGKPDEKMQEGQRRFLMVGIPYNQRYNFHT